MTESYGQNTEVFIYNKLSGGSNVLPVSEGITLDAGDLPAGAVLGKITGGNYVLSLSTVSDGSQVPDCILAKDTDASGGAVVTVAYKSGEYNQDALTLGAAHTAASIKEGLRDKNIYLKDSVQEDGT